MPHSQATPAARAAPALRAGLRPLLLLVVGWAFGKCGLRRSPRGAPRKVHANRQRVPPRWGTPAIAAPRGQCKRQRCRPGQRPHRGHRFRVPTAPPVALAAPAPRPHRSAAQQRAGRFRSVAPCAPCRAHPVAHRLPPVPSLHGPRHRSCTGSRLLAALAPSRRPGRRTPQTAAAKLRIRKRPRGTDRTGSGPAPGPNSAHNSASVIRNCQGN